MAQAITIRELHHIQRAAATDRLRLHRLSCTLTLPGDEYREGVARLRFIRQFTSALASVEGQQPDQALAHYDALTDDLLGSWLRQEALRSAADRVAALRQWAEARVMVCLQRPGAPSSLKRSAQRIHDQFAPLIQFALEQQARAPARGARIVEGLLEAYHNALYELLGEDPLDPQPTETEGSPPCLATCKRRPCSSSPRY